MVHQELDAAVLDIRELARGIHPHTLNESGLAAAIACGLGAGAVAPHEGQLTTYAGASGWASAVDLLAGWGLGAAGLATSQLRPGVIAGRLAVAAGFAWFAPDFVGWEGGPAVVRSL